MTHRRLALLLFLAWSVAGCCLIQRYWEPLEYSPWWATTQPERW